MVLREGYPLSGIGSPTSFSAMFSKGDNFCDTVGLPGGRSILKMRSTVKEKNLLLCIINVCPRGYHQPRYSVFRC